MKIKAKVSYAACSLSVIGMEMNCPLCGAFVKSGGHHECMKLDKDKPATPKPKK
jgi:hypothetical protein